MRAKRARWHVVFHNWDSLGEGIHAEMLRQWVQGITMAEMHNMARVMWLCHAVGVVAEKACRHDQGTAQCRWRKWLREGHAGGLGRQHRMSRCATGFIAAKSARTELLQEGDDDISAEDDVEGISERDLEALVCSSCPMDKQESVDDEAEAWAQVWREGQEEFKVEWPADLGTPLPDVAISTFREACGTFRNSVGLGWDKMHPKAIARCSDAAISCLIHLLALAERRGKWPSIVGIILIVLLPKSDGGRRPIGLFPTLIRVWMRIRLTVAQQWVEDHERQSLYAGPGKGAEVAAWRQGALAEAARAMSMEYATSLLDLVKAFDSIPYDWLVRQAERFGYNLWMLRLSISAYRLGRVLVIDGCCSRTVVGARGLTAGSALATIELRVLLIQWADRAAAVTLHARITIYVDDATIETVGTKRLVERYHAEVVNTFTTDLRLMRLEFSPTKNVTCGSTHAIAKKVAEDITGISMKVVSRCVSLGTGLGAGRRRNAQQMGKRLGAFRARVPRFKALKRNGVDTARLLRTGGNAAMLFGGRVMGTSTSMLQRLSFASAAWRSRCPSPFPRTASQRYRQCVTASLCRLRSS